MTNQQVAGSIADVIGFFSWPNPFSWTMALGLTQPLTEIEYHESSWAEMVAGT
jgi:hypothetical protein